MSAARFLERGADELGRAGIAEARVEAELLLRHALGCTRESLLARLQEPVPAEATGHFFQLVERRRGRVPVQYIIGTQEFYGLSFRVTPAVLIPRPETEGVVEQTALAFENARAPRIADIGCGSGCIAVALAHTLRDAELVAIDRSKAALAIARENALRHGVVARVELLESDLLEAVADSDLDAVVSNPPYIPDEELAGLEPEVTEHEPRDALSGGADGLDVIRRLVPQAHRALRPGGMLVLEIGHGQSQAVETLLREAALLHERTVPDLAGIPRIVIARKL
ncbi:MAG: peptide chain release factor N(5)-glutamine methyltransferase [Acidobacteria bacterium]|nr:MAG: peptide chain release factor N(5)-glutamine methyltransferase [Acidobacteriota bacterium]